MRITLYTRQDRVFVGALLVLLLLLFSSSPSGGNERDFRREFSGTDSPHVCIRVLWQWGGEGSGRQWTGQVAAAVRPGRTPPLLSPAAVSSSLSSVSVVYLLAIDDLSGGVLWAAPTWPDPWQCRERNRWCPGKVPHVMALFPSNLSRVR